ncbi:MAG: 16S rRNA (cytosine(967)-C(5))-methyltransferase RsmB [Acidobacteriota bacterium]
MKIATARTAAFEALLRIERDAAFSSVILPRVGEKLEQKDRSLCYEIVLGVLRRQIYLDRLIDLSVTKGKLDIEVRLALRIGVFQLLFLDRVPDYSVLNESVELVKRAKKTSAKGLVNAVLRRLSRDKPEIEYADELERISIETSHPRWLIEKWTKAFGPSKAESIAAANNIQPRNEFRLTARSIRSGFEPNSEWIPSYTVDGCFTADRLDGELLGLVRSGDIYFQDEASQMMALAVEVAAGETFLDVCAAPGGKTTLIASHSIVDSKMIVAGDLRWPRVELLHENCKRQQAAVSVVQYDAGEDLPFADDSFDAVLVDAPCSGTGTIRHNPEIRYTVKPDDFDESSNKQLQILTNASKIVKSGGRLYYSTCSLEPEENESVISRFLVDANHFQIIPSEVSEKFISQAGFFRTFPDRDEMDGFFLAVMRKR